MEINRWGIIYCPKQGVRRTHKRWERIKELLDAKGVDFDFVQSEGPRSVERLMKMLCQNGYETIIIVGGDSALNRAVNGLLTLDEGVRKKVAIGIIPNGRGNDFATFWGLREDADEQTIDSLIQRRVRKIDVGYIRGINSETGEEKTRYFVNCLNIGLVANIMKLKYKTRQILGLATLSYFASMILMLVQRLEKKMQLHINEDSIDKKLMNVCVGNGHSYGQTPSAVPYNGCLDVSIIAQPGVKQLVEGLGLLFTGKLLNHKDVKAYRTTRPIHIEETQNATVSTDGRVLKNFQPPMVVGLLPEHINFIIPS